MGMATRYGVVELGWPALENPDQASSLFITQVFPPVVQGILFAAIVAAILSTADSFLIVGSSAFSRDIYQKYIFPKYLGGKEKYAFDEVWLARGMTFVLGFVPALIIINPPTIIMWLGALGWGIFAASLMSVVVFGLHWNHANRYGAIGAVVVGLIVSVGGGILNVGYDVDLVLHPGAWGVVLSVITMIVLSKATPSPTTTRNAAVSDD
jgi:Na+/proline symporter